MHTESCFYILYNENVLLKTCMKIRANRKERRDLVTLKPKSALENCIYTFHAV
jgi:hypothetical protein